jgi:hypothetical protein
MGKTRKLKTPRMIGTEKRCGEEWNVEDIQGEGD